MVFLLGLLVGLIPLWFYWRRHQRFLATWKKRLLQEQENYQQLQQNYQRLTQAHQALQQELDNLRHNHATILQEQEQLKQLHREVLQKVHQLELPNPVASHSLQQELATLRRDYETAIQEQVTLTQKIQQLEQENQQLRCQNHAELEQDYQKLIHEYEQMQHEYKIAMRERTELTQRLQHIEQENQKLKDERNYYEQCAIEAEEQKHLIQQENAQLEAQIQQRDYHRPYQTVPPKSAQSDLEVNGKQARQIILYSHEIDLYPDELYEMILTIFQEELNRIPPDTYKRRYHLLQSLLEANQSQGYREQIKQQIEQLFSKYMGATRRLERELINLGFDFTEGTTHHKITWHQDSRYVFSFAKTPSDYRAGRNISRDLIHLLF